MSELPDLPPPPRRTRPLPEGGLDAVVAAGRTRRSRALAAGTTTALAVVLAAVLVPPTGAVQALHAASTGAVEALGAAFRPGPDPVAAPTDEPSAAAAPTAEPTQEPVAEPTVDPTAAVATASSAPASPRTASASPVAEEPAGGPSSPSPSPTAPARATPTASPSGEATPTPAAPAELPAFREDTAEASVGATTCTPGPEEAVCSYETTSGTSVERGEQVVVAAGRCQGRGAPPTVYAFAGGQEKDVVVTDAAGRTVFRFSDTVRYVEGAHERRTRSGTCLQWTGRWSLVTTAGEPVPAGTYRVTTTVAVDRVHPAGDEAAGERDVRASSSVTVSVVG